MAFKRKTISVKQRHEEFLQEKMQEDDFVFSVFVQSELDRLMAEKKLKEEMGNTE